MIIKHAAGLFSGLRFRLLLLVVLACAPLVALTVNTSLEDRRKARMGFRSRAARLAQVAQRDQERVLESARQMLTGMANSAPVQEGSVNASQKLIDYLYSDRFPRFSNLGVLKTNGTLLASAAPPQQPMNESSRKYFRRALASKGFAVGDFPPKSNSEAILNFGLPVPGKQGEIQSVAFASLDLDWYTQFGSELISQLPKGASWIEVDRRGLVLFEAPGDTGKVGDPFPEGDILRAVAAEHKGFLERRNAKGEREVVAFSSFYSPMAGRRATGILAVPAATLFADADHALIRSLQWMAAAIGVAFMIGWVGSKTLVLQPVQAVVRSSSRLAAGDLSARIGLPHGRDELGMLTRAFDRMAQALEQRELEQNHANQKLQLLSRRLVEAQETERRQIARELHDEIGQALTAAELSLDAAMQSQPGTALQPRLEASSNMIRDVLEKVQDLSLNLRPSMLDDLGLEAAVRWYAGRQCDIGKLEQKFYAAPLQDRLDPVIETECFRIAQEALTNVVRHARARSVCVRIAREDDRLLLSVKDDGIGFQVATFRERAVQGDSLGLLSMEERAALAGGGFEIISSTGLGTEVRAWFPLRWRNGTN